MSASAAQSALALQRPIQTLSVGCCVAMAMAMLPAAYQGELFAWHPLMFTLGFIGFMTEAGAAQGGGVAPDAKAPLHSEANSLRKGWPALERAAPPQQGWAASNQPLSPPLVNPMRAGHHGGGALPPQRGQHPRGRHHQPRAHPERRHRLLLPRLLRHFPQ